MGKATLIRAVQKRHPQKSSSITVPEVRKRLSWIETPATTPIGRLLLETRLNHGVHYDTRIHELAEPYEGWVISALWFETMPEGLSTGIAPERAQADIPKTRLEVATQQALWQYCTEKPASAAQAFQHLPIAPQTGTRFQQDAWKALQAIPYGETRSYSEQAKLMGHPLAIRAIGQANRRNPIPILIPCHRVIGASGELRGYAGSGWPDGLRIKQFLLDLESHGISL